MLAILSIFRLWPFLLSAILLGVAFRLVSWANRERTRSGSLEQSPPLSVRFTPGLRLDLQPIVALAGSVGCIAALAHYALEAMQIGRLEELPAVIEGLRQVRA